MARPKTMRFGKFKVLVGDGSSPEVFGAPCGFTERSLEFTADTNSTPVPDCDNPDDPIWAESDITTLSAQITGQGVLALKSGATDPQKVWRDWFMGGEVRNIRVQFDVPLADGGGHYEGQAILTQLKFDSNYGDKVKVSVTIRNTSAWEWVDAAS